MPWPDPEHAGDDLMLATQPNPFRAQTRVNYSIPRAGRVQVTVHDIGGRLVALLARGPQTAGEHFATWDGSDGAGAPSKVGVYFVRMEFEGRTRVGKLVRIE